MGCDGGTIPRRDELVRTKKKPETKDKEVELAFQWRCCSVTQQTLQHPVVTCGLGRLYNKLSLIEALISKDSLQEGARHIKSLKDVKELNLTPNPEYKSSSNDSGMVDQTAPFICPVIGLEMSGKFRFIALWSCGCVFSERALKEIKSKICHKCLKPFCDDDVVILNGNEKEDLALMKERMEIRLKRRKEKRVKNGNSSTVVKSEPEAGCSSVKVEGTEKNSEIPSKRLEKPSLKRSGALVAPQHSKIVKADYSVAKDPQVSDVYKSLFTSHKSEQEQNRAHWITYNPFYN